MKTILSIVEQSDETPHKITIVQIYDRVLGQKQQFVRLITGLLTAHYRLSRQMGVINPVKKHKCAGYYNEE